MSPKIEYTVSISRAVFSQEVYELYVKYEQSVHNRKELSPENLLRHLCNSPVYDPELEANSVGATAAPQSH